MPNSIPVGLPQQQVLSALTDLDSGISVAPAIMATVYAELDGQKLLMPINAADIPNQAALAQCWGRFCGEKDGAG